MRKMMACMLGAALCFSMAGAETGVSSAEKASSPFGRMIWNRGWEFRLEDEPGKSGWQTVHLPHTFSLPYFMSDSFYTGLGSYRKKLVMPEEWQGKKVFLDCGASFQVAEVKVNGKTAGRHEGGYTAFRSDLTPFLKPGEKGGRYGWITAGAPALRRGRGSILFPEDCTGTCICTCVLPCICPRTEYGFRRRR